MTFLLLALAFVLAIVCVAYVLVVYAPTSAAAVRLKQWRDRMLHRAPPHIVTVIQEDEAIDVAVPNTGDTVWMPYARRSRAPLHIRSQTVAVIAAVLIALVALSQLPRLIRAQPEQFIVLVAPFRAANGDAASGSAATQQIVAALRNTDAAQIRVEPLGTSPATVADALALMQREGADVLISGELASGGGASPAMLQPVLIYQPTGTFAPAGLEGYPTRFALPSVYPLASAPITGSLVLPPLLAAVQAYSAGDFTASFERFGVLLGANLPLRPELARSLRGNMLWASGQYAAAADEYRSIVPLQGPLEAAPERAMLANNLGAILQDAGDADADAAFTRAVQLLGGHDLGQLRVNLARQALRADQPGAAVEALEQAQRLLPSTLALDLARAEAYRAAGQFAQADAVIADASAQVGSGQQLGPPAWRTTLATRASADVAAERARLRLTRMLDAPGPLFWELISGGVATRAPAPSSDMLGDVHTQIEQAVEQTDALARRWREQAAVADANRAPLDGLVAATQSQHAEAALQARQQLLASVEIELARAQGYTPPQGLAAVWSNVASRRSPIEQAEARLSRLLQATPGAVEAQVELGRVLLLDGKIAEAAQQFDAAAASGRPEPVYGQALVAQRNATDGDARARQLFDEALRRDARFYPAREALAALAEERSDWAALVEQRRALAQQFPTPARQLALGRALRQSGPSGAAEAEQLLLPLANANNPGALLELGQLYETNGRPDAARIVLERANNAAPRDPQVAFYLGKALAAQGDADGAKAQYRIAIDADPRYVDAYLALAELSSDNPAEAARAYRAAIDADLNDTAALKRIGAALLDNGNADVAVTAYKRAVEFSPNDAEAHHGLARALLQQGELDDAAAEEQTALQLRGDTYPEAWVGLGDIALARNDPQQALGRYNTAIQQDDSLASAYIGLGRARAAQLEWDAARAEFQTAVNRDPASPEAYLWLGEARIRQGDTDGAIAAYQESLQHRPNYSNALFGLAQAQFAKQDAPAALDNVAAALAQRPNYAEALLLKGKILEAQGESAAQDAYSAAIAADPNLGEPRYRRGLLRVRQSSIADAREDFEQAVAVQNNFPEAHYWLGRMYLIEDRPDDAQEQFATAISQRVNGYPEAQFYQGLAQEQLGQPDNALASFEKVLEQARSSSLGREAEAAITRLRQ